MCVCVCNPLTQTQIERAGHPLQIFPLDQGKSAPSKALKIKQRVLMIILIFTDFAYHFDDFADSGNSVSKYASNPQLNNDLIPYFITTVRCVHQ